VFVYWYGPLRTGTKIICLLVHMGSDRSIVGPGHNRLLGTRPFLMWFVAETIQQGVHKGCVRLLIRNILIWYGTVRSKQTIRAVPVPLCGPTVG
jgi:hypothetical protein